jgi:hypothetical protein
MAKKPQRNPQPKPEKEPKLTGVPKGTLKETPKVSGVKYVLRKDALHKVKIC